LINKPLADQAARDQIVQDLDKNFLVEAGAGSGKTTCMLERMLAMIRRGILVENIAAVTFTRKAAGEMAERFQIRLEAEWAKSSDPNCRQALDNLDQLFIGTIHSFCGRMLRERPVEAGLSPDFTEVDEVAEDVHRARFFANFVQHLKLVEDARLSQLQCTGVDLTSLYAGFVRIVDNLDLTFPVDSVPLPDPVAALVAWGKIQGHLARLLPLTAPDKGYDIVQKAVRRAIIFARYRDLTDLPTAMSLLEILAGEKKVTQNRWSSKDEALAAQGLYDSFATEHATPLVRQWHAYRYAVAIPILREAADEYLLQLEAQGQLTFAMLLSKAGNLLRDRQEVREYFAQRYRYLLVDEFQDTDPLQAELMFLLCAVPGPVTGWEHVSLRPGSLFVVGDPKQSIYRFRRADISIYSQVKELLHTGGGEVLYLTANFRSVPEIVDWVDDACSMLFATGEHPHQVDFSVMEAVREAASSPRAGVWLSHVERGGKGAPEDFLTRHGDALAGTLKQLWQEDGFDLAEALLLFRNKKRIAIYAAALMRHGLPYTVAGGGNLANSCAVKELAKAIAFLADPANQVLLVAVLRGGFFGVSDVALAEFKKDGGCFSIFAPTPASPAPNPALRQQRVADCLDTLRELYACTDSHPPLAAVCRIAEKLGLGPLVLSQVDKEGEFLAALHVLELLASFASSGCLGFADIATYLATLVDQDGGIAPETELDLYCGRRPSVRLMNLHKAKGLEGQLVVLADPTGAGNHPPDFHSRREAGRATGYLRLMRESPNGFTNTALASPMDWDSLSLDEKLYQQAEEQRLLYVAATRAKDTLLISRIDKYNNYNPWAPLTAAVEESFATPAPAQERPDTSPSVAAEAFIPVEPDAFPTWRRQIADRRQTLQQPSYQVASVTGMTKSSAVAGPRRSSAGKGTSWGTAVHRSLQLLGQQRIAPSALAEERWQLELTRILLTQGREEAELTELTSLLGKVLATPFWHELLAATEAYFELSFRYYADGRLVAGAIDLVYCHQGQWKLVDYKTDHLIDPAHQAELTAFYLPQLDYYCQVWEASTGHRVATKELLFTASL